MKLFHDEFSPFTDQSALDTRYTLQLGTVLRNAVRTIPPFLRKYIFVQVLRKLAPFLAPDLASDSNT